MLNERFTISEKNRKNLLNMGFSEAQLEWISVMPAVSKQCMLSNPDWIRHLLDKDVSTSLVITSAFHDPLSFYKEFEEYSKENRRSKENDRKL